jgi:hypothetical protein
MASGAGGGGTRIPDARRVIPDIRKSRQNEP